MFIAGRIRLNVIYVIRALLHNSHMRQLLKSRDSQVGMIEWCIAVNSQP